MIFCVEDDASIRDIEVYTLKATGLDAIGLANAKELEQALKNEKPQLVILDIMLPDEDGISILKKLRMHSQTAEIPVIMATAKGEEFDKVQALDLGADDYIAKPFGMMEMVSRVKAVLRRSHPAEPSSVLEYQGIRLDRSAHCVWADGTALTLTLKEYNLLELLMENPGVVFSREKLLESVWNMDFSVETRTVDVHIRTLREKIGSYSDCIETVRGVGYRLQQL
ncbi:MAG: response regulator transcription factor [Sphaerochaetaceae bacterium]|nr:response regulator transcription factor [Sphaerochaetaceae bacterium]MDD3162550.1 response regulator transcription factor [Sphaerochaetaceae bacterium]MDD4006360.1 response regulator transcription factor [Sphaerochaetaceae bacterium]MDD4396029.1 response regulator transcription factor [Sphaerochaetaceae bacterium]